MKKKIWIGVGVVLLGIIGFFVYGALTTRGKSPSETVPFTYNGTDIKVVYCRPSKRGRLIFGEEKDKALQPYGKYWRLGANEATTISFSNPVMFAGKAIPAGDYRMYAVPGAQSWQISLNTDLGKWGYFEPDYSLDVLKVDVPAETGPETEQFTINFASDSTAAAMTFMWDKTIVRVPITLP